jgi:hypothetical protein
MDPANGVDAGDVTGGRALVKESSALYRCFETVIRMASTDSLTLTLSQREGEFLLPAGEDQDEGER